MENNIVGWASVFGVAQAVRDVNGNLETVPGVYRGTPGVPDVDLSDKLWIAITPES